MKNKAVSLRDLTKLSHYSELSERYIRYICGINDDRQYRHKEIEDIAALISMMFLPEKSLSGFIYGYVVPQLNKEFDLLIITSNSCVNIELIGLVFCGRMLCVLTCVECGYAPPK